MGRQTDSVPTTHGQTTRAQTPSHMCADHSCQDLVLCFDGKPYNENDTSNNVENDNCSFACLDNVLMYKCDTIFCGTNHSASNKLCPEHKCRSGSTCNGISSGNTRICSQYICGSYCDSAILTTVVDRCFQQKCTDTRTCLESKYVISLTTDQARNFEVRILVSVVG